jgi:hypothetical protein
VGLHLHRRESLGHHRLFQHFAGLGASATILPEEPLAKLLFSVILNGVKDLNRLKIRDSSLRSE